MAQEVSANTDDKCSEGSISSPTNAISATRMTGALRFFNLPLELRDSVYSFASNCVDLDGTQFGLCAGRLRFRVLSPKLWGVSRRFKQEYERLLPHEVKMRAILMIPSMTSTPDSSTSIPKTLRSRLTHIRKAYLTSTVHSFIKGIVGANQLGQDVAKLLSLMPTLERIEIKVLLSVEGAEHLLALASAPTSLSELARCDLDSPLFACCPKEMIANIPFRYALTVACPLFSPNPGAFDDDISRALMGPGNSSNQIYFLASASDGGYTWHGLDLEVDMCSGTFEKALAIARTAKKDIARSDT